MPVHDPRTLRVVTVEESRAMLVSALENKPGAPRDVVALNAGAAMYAAGLAESLTDGIDRARQAIANGSARQKLADLAGFSVKSV